MLRELWSIVALLMLTVTTTACAEEANRQGQGSFRVVSYNVENLFDTTDDPLTDDDDFLPDGELEWTEGRYRNKINRISWVLSNIGEWSYPDLIGLVEVENDEVVQALTNSKSLRQAEYKYVVSDGADPRGIDVALMWRRERFKLIEAREIPHYGQLMFYPHGGDQRSRKEREGTGRNTLWVTLEERSSGAQFEVFVIHAPSRRGGARSTQENRSRVMEKLNQVIERLFQKNPMARIIVMGDFNDNPKNLPINKVLGASTLKQANGNYRKRRLYNLASDLAEQGKGTHYYGGEFWMPDHIIVSGSLLMPDQSIRVTKEGLQIFAPHQLQHRGRPNRTYRGTHHTGGYSDHYPIFVDITLE